jgi:hypothetical protein
MNGCRVASAARLAALVFRWSKQLTKVACQLAQGESIDLPVLPCTDVFCVPDLAPIRSRPGDGDFSYVV